VSESRFERNLFALRQKKLAEIEKLGQAKYPNQCVATHTIPEVRAERGEV
jgi:lysyl-tRNA synthetase class 2